MRWRSARPVVCASWCGILLLGCDSSVAATRERILQTNLVALLAGCREVLGHRGSYRANPHYNGGTEAVRAAAPDPKDPTMPPVIRQLAPTYIEVFEDSVHLGFAAGSHHVDVMAFAQGVDDEARGRQIGKGRRLLAGLWYYEDLE
jgi:hypothetical protein